MKKLNLPKGEFKCKRDTETGTVIYVDLNGDSRNVAVMQFGFLGDIKSCTELFCDAGTIANQTGLTPSELLKQRDELLEALTEFCDRAVRGEIQVFHDGENPFIGIDKALKSITKQS